MNNSTKKSSQTNNSKYFLLLIAGAIIIYIGIVIIMIGQDTSNETQNTDPDILEQNIELSTYTTAFKYLINKEYLSDMQMTAITCTNHNDVPCKIKVNYKYEISYTDENLRKKEVPKTGSISTAVGAEETRTVYDYLSTDFSDAYKPDGTLTMTGDVTLVSAKEEIDENTADITGIGECTQISEACVKNISIDKTEDDGAEITFILTNNTENAWHSCAVTYDLFYDNILIYDKKTAYTLCDTDVQIREDAVVEDEIRHEDWMNTVYPSKQAFEEKDISSCISLDDLADHLTVKVNGIMYN